MITRNGCLETGTILFMSLARSVYGPLNAQVVSIVLKFMFH